jgi:hypothetical protein
MAETQEPEAQPEQADPAASARAGDVSDERLD